MLIPCTLLTLVLKHTHTMYNMVQLFRNQVVFNSILVSRDSIKLLPCVNKYYTASEPGVCSLAAPVYVSC